MFSVYLQLNKIRTFHPRKGKGASSGHPPLTTGTEVNSCLVYIETVTKDKLNIAQKVVFDSFVPAVILAFLA